MYFASLQKRPKRLFHTSLNTAQIDIENRGFESRQLRYVDILEQWVLSSSILQSKFVGGTEMKQGQQKFDFYLPAEDGRKGHLLKIELLRK